MIELVSIISICSMALGGIVWDYILKFRNSDKIRKSRRLQKELERQRMIARASGSYQK